MSRTKGAAPLTQAEMEAVWRLRKQEKLTWQKIAEIMHRDRSGLCRAFARHFPQKKLGRPLVRAPYGELLCTRRNHLVHYTEFAYTHSGTVNSWCRDCKREHDRKRKALRARDERMQRSLIAKNALVHVIHRTNNS